MDPTGLRSTDRAGAAEAARQFGQTLPDETELVRVTDPDRVQPSMPGQPTRPAGRLVYRQVWDQETDPAPDNVVMEQILDPRRAVLFHHWRGEWVFDPLTLHLLLNKDKADGERRLTFVDRQTAEEIARSFGQVLPSEAELRSMMEAGAAEMYATDRVMKRAPMPGDPGWPEA